MSGIGDTLKGIRDLLLLQRDVRDLEEAVEGQREDVHRLTHKVTDLDKRLYAVERIMDLGVRQTRQKRIEE
ncbi:MAG: hypothetical protein WA954_01350 [Parerythrobacter sp.]